MTEIGFEGADYYGSEDEETMSHSTPEDYIAEVVDEGALVFPFTREQLLEHYEDGIMVVAYRRKQFDARDVERAVTGAVESLLEDLQEEYGPPDQSEWFDAKEEQDLVQKIMPVVTATLTERKVWACEPDAEKLYTAEQILAIVADEYGLNEGAAA